MAEKQKTLIYINKENLAEADFMSRNFVDKEIKNRAFINTLGAEAFIKYLNSEGINTGNLRNMHSISRILGQIDIADVLLRNIYIDVRVVFNENQIFIPKTHFKYDIQPDVYVVLKLGQNFEYFELLGYFEPNSINFAHENENYYFYESYKLQFPEKLIRFIRYYDAHKFKYIPEDKILRGKELSINLADNDISAEEFKELMNLMINSRDLRDSILEYDNFETLSHRVAPAMNDENKTEGVVTEEETENSEGQTEGETSEENSENTPKEEVLSQDEDENSETAEETEQEIQTAEELFGQDLTFENETQEDENEPQEEISTEISASDITTEDDIVDEPENIEEENVNIESENENNVELEPTLEDEGETIEFDSSFFDEEDLNTEELEQEEEKSSNIAEIAGEAVEAGLGIAAATATGAVAAEGAQIAANAAAGQEAIDLAAIAGNEIENLTSIDEEVNTEEPVEETAEILEEVQNIEDVDIVTNDTEEETLDFNSTEIESEPEFDVNSGLDIDFDSETTLESDIMPEENFDNSEQEEFENVELLDDNLAENQEEILDETTTNLSDLETISTELETDTEFGEEDLQLLDSDEETINFDQLETTENLSSETLEEDFDSDSTDIQDLGSLPMLNVTEESDNSQETYDEVTQDMLSLPEQNSEQDFTQDFEQAEEVSYDNTIDFSELDIINTEEENSQDSEEIQDLPLDNSENFELTDLNNINDEDSNDYLETLNVTSDTGDTNDYDLNTLESQELLTNKDTEDDNSDYTFDMSQFEETESNLEENLADEAQEQEMPDFDNQQQWDNTEDETSEINAEYSQNIADEFDIIDEEQGNFVEDKSEQNAQSITNNGEIGEISIDINNSDEQDVYDEAQHLENIYNESNNFPQSSLNNSARFVRNNQGKSPSGAFVVISGILVLALVAVIGLSAFKMIKPAAEEQQPSVSDNQFPQIPENATADNSANVDTNKIVTMDNTPTTQTPVAKTSPAQAQTSNNTKKIPATSFLEISKLSWEVPDYISANGDFKRYFQSTGKSLKAALSNDLLLANDYIYSKEMRLSVTFDKSGVFKESRPLISSGSQQVDKIVLQSVNQTLNALKAPNSLGNDQSTTVILKIYF